MRKGLKSLLLLIVSVSFLGACAGTTDSTKDDSTVSGSDSDTLSSSGSGSATTSATGSGSTWTGNPLDDPDSLLVKRTVYFAFDESVIVDGDRPILEAHAQYLSQNPGAAVTLEGHTDERGTREYNLALGEQRAISVRQFMSLLGASGQQMRTVSYGEERPAALGHDEESWAQNRRVEIIYRNR
ncbi:MAG: peptidoglycan-associated lipoprotein Pal [Gammaproteobacteria bacterium]|nr:peptidoglycan-associated lipoprotein Pal [Gammaproteobacteria bacterium]MDX2462037.1 peptidoglycan-associated lipoprotein Pal [Gammaproteobacteria bacterium]